MITEQDKIKQTEKLTKAVIALTVRFKKNEELVNKSGIIAKLQRSGNSISGMLKEKASDAFSLKGASSLLGVSSGGMIGQYLSSRHEGIKERKGVAKGEAQKAARFAQNYSKYDTEGQKLASKNENAAIKEGVRLYEEQKSILAEIKKIKEEISEAEEVGQGDIVKKGRAEDLGKLENRLSTLYDKPAEPAGLSKKEANAMASQLMKRGEVVKRAVTSMEKTTGEPLSPDDKSELTKGIKAGMVEELLKSNEQQVIELRKLVSKAELSEEEALEAKIRATPGAVKPIAEIKKENKNGIFDLLFSGIKNLFPMLTSVIRYIPTVVGTIAALLKGGASMLPKINPKGLIKGAAAGAVMLGAANLVDYGLGKAGVGGNEIDSTQDDSNWDKMSGAEKLESGAARGIEKVADFLGLENLSNEAKSERIKLETDYLKNRSKVEKADITSREVQTNAMSENRQVAEQLNAEKAKVESKTSSPSTNVITTNNVKNNTNITRLSPPTRNIDPTYNQRLSFGSR